MEIKQNTSHEHEERARIMPKFSQMPDKQRKAMFANLRELAQRSGLLKKAAIGGALALTGGIIAWRSPALRKKALAMAGAGVATAAGYGGRAYEFTQEQKREALEQARKAKSAAATLGRARVQWALEQGKAIPVEKLTASAVDLPFEWAEGQLAKGIERRTQSLEALLANRLSGLQALSTEKLAKRARALHTKAFGLEGEKVDLATKLAREKYRESFMQPPKKLRRTVETDKWRRALSDLMLEAMKTGKQFVTPNEAEIDLFLTRAGLKVNDENRRRLRSLFAGSQVFGTMATLGG